MKPLEISDILLSGTSLIEASAGTGKTWTIAALYMRLLLERSLQPENILVVTYTKAATAELKERIRLRILSTLEIFSGKRAPGEELEKLLFDSCSDADYCKKVLTRALYSFDDAAIFTIHGFCQRVLSDNAFESNSLFNTEMVTDQSLFLNEAVDDFWRTVVMSETDDFFADLIARGHNPQSLLEPFRGHFQSPFLNIIPTPDPVDFSAINARRDTLFRQAAALWQSSRESILSLMLSPGLSQKSYKPQQIGKAADLLESWLYGHPSAGCDKLSLFCIENLLKNTNKGSITPRHDFFSLCQELKQACEETEKAFAHELIRLQAALHSWLTKELPRRKRLENLRCYDDLLLDLNHALEGENGKTLAGRIREKYKAALIDEFQDTDQLQWSIFQQIAAPADYPMFIIGDPKQAIYSFRGADIHAYLAAGNAVENNMRWTLDTNRRSSRLLVDAVNAIFSNSSDPFLCNGIEFQPVHPGRNANDQLLIDGRPVGTPLRFWIYPSEGDRQQNKSIVRMPIATAVASEILRLLHGSCHIRKDQTLARVEPGDMAVLVRTHSQASIIQDALSTLGIPSVQHGSQTIFETEESLDLLRILRAADDPGNESLVKEALLGGLLGANANMLDEMLRDDLRWDIWLGRFRDMRAAFRSGGMVALSSCLLEECGARRSILSLPDGERRLTNLLHCVELVHQASAERPASLAGCIEWLEKRISRRQEDETALLRLETDQQAVRIATIHASKGLQYPIVFLPFAWDAPFTPSGRALFHDGKGNLTIDLGSDDYNEHLEKFKTEQEAEAARLLYVAMTRAEFRCYVVWGAIRQADATPLFRLLHGKAGRPFNEYDDNAIMADIADLSSAAPGIEAERMPQGHDLPSYNGNSRKETPLACPIFKGSIPNDWRVSSFSAIAGHPERHLQPRDIDAVATVEETGTGERQPGAGSFSIFDFPRGAEAGTCLHELFEELDFAGSTESIIAMHSQQCLQRNGYDLCWLPAVTGMVEKVLQTPMLADEPGFRISGLKPGSWLTEMEFYLPLGRINSSRLKEAFSGQISISRHGRFEEQLAALQIQETHGLLVGFMDMVFEYKRRYYIVDWKSNHLGYNLESYGQQQLQKAMAEHSYILQYHLYALALDRMLARKLPDYDYETHFGGAIYIFLRGIEPSQPEAGIFRDRPAIDFIRKANQLLLANGELQ